MNGSIVFSTDCGNVTLSFLIERIINFCECAEFGKIHFIFGNKF